MTKIFIATPAFQGKVNVQYAISLTETVNLLIANGIMCETKIVTSGSILPAERNRLLEAFIESDCTHILCIDGDLGWHREYVLRMLLKDEPMICGCYPARVGFNFIFTPELNEDESIVCNIEKKLIKMKYVPAGFMLIRKEVIVKMREKFSNLKFIPKSLGSFQEQGYALFDHELRDEEFWGEDYVFCRRVRECGFDIWCDPNMIFDHDGVVGSLSEILTNDRDKKAECKVG